MKQRTSVEPYLGCRIVGEMRDTSMKSRPSSLGFYSPPVLVWSLPV